AHHQDHLASPRIEPVPLVVGRHEALAGSAIGHRIPGRDDCFALIAEDRHHRLLVPAPERLHQRLRGLFGGCEATLRGSAESGRRSPSVRQAHQNEDDAGEAPAHAPAMPGPTLTHRRSLHDRSSHRRPPPPPPSAGPRAPPWAPPNPCAPPNPSAPRPPWVLPPKEPAPPRLRSWPPCSARPRKASRDWMPCWLAVAPRL